MEEHRPASDSEIPGPETWVDRYGDYLYRYAFSILRDPAIAEDVVQETFLAALEAQKNFWEHLAEFWHLAFEQERKRHERDILDIDITEAQPE